MPKFNSSLISHRLKKTHLCRSALVAAVGSVTPSMLYAAAGVDQINYYFDGSTSVGSNGTNALLGFDYNPLTNTFYTASAGTSGNGLSTVTNSGSSWSNTINVGLTSWVNQYLAANYSSGTPTVLPSDYSASNSIGDLVLNPKPLTLSGINYAANTVAVIIDQGAVKQGSTSFPQYSKEVYAWDLRSIGQPFAAGTRNLSGSTTTKYSDVFVPPILTLADMQSAESVIESTTVTASPIIARRFAYSSDGQSIYFNASTANLGGIWKDTLTTPGANGLTKLVDARLGTNKINTEPAVVASTVRNFGGGSGDQILFQGSSDTGNDRGIEYVVDSGVSGPTAVSKLLTPQTLITSKQLQGFFDFEGALPNVQSITADASGNIFFSNSSNPTGLFEYDVNGRLAKIFSSAEQHVIDSATGATVYNQLILDTTVKQQTVTLSNNTTASLPVVYFTDAALSTPLSAIAYTPGDFNRDGVVNQADVTLFKAQLGLRGATTASFSGAGSSAVVVNPDGFKFDLNGSSSSGTGSATNVVASVDWKDAQIFAQYAGLSYGDVDMNGVVNQTDFNTLASNYNTDGKIWTQGNLTSVRIAASDKDMVNYADLVTLAANYPAGSKPTITGYGSTVQTDADRAFAVTANGTISQLTATNFAGAVLNWSDAVNWSNGVPNAAGAVASFLTKPLNDTTVNIASSETVGQLNFDNYFTYTLSGSGTLHLAGNNGTTAEVNTFAASPTIANAVSLDSATNVTINASSDTATFSGPITGAGSFTKLGGGAVYLTGSNSYSGNTLVSAGTLQTVNAGALPGYNVAGKVAVLSGATLVANAGGMIEWSGTDLDTLRSKAAFATGSTLGINTANSAGQFTYASNITGSLAVNKLGSNTLFLSGTNTYTGTTTVTSGILDASLPVSLPGYATAGQITVNSGSTLGVAVGTGHWSSANVATLLSNVTFNTGSFVGLDTTYGGFAYAGNIGGNSGLAKLGSNTLTLTGSNSYLGSTAVNGGTLQLSFTGAATTTNIVPAVTALILSNNGGLTVTGVANSSTALSQSFNTSTGVTFNTGSAAIIVNDLSASGGAPLNVALGALTRNVGATVDFTLPTGSSSGLTSSVSFGNNVIGGWATVGQTDWASKSSNNVIALLSSQYTSNAWSQNNSTTVTSSNSPSSGSVTNTLRFNANSANTVTLSGVNNIGTGGILITPNVGANTSAIIGGTLTGASGKDLIVHQFNTAGSFTIGSIIADSTTSTGLTKAGGGTLTLTAANTYTGSTFVNAGLLQISSGSIASTTINVLNGATLQAIPLTALPTTANLTTTGTVNFTGNTATTGGPAALTIASLAIGNGGIVTVNDPGNANRANRTLLVTSSLTLAGGTDLYNGTLDLAGNDLIIHGGSLSNLTNQIKSGFANGSWNGSGVTSSTARNNAAHLTALGVISNNNGSGTPLYGSSTPLGLFDGNSPSTTDILSKYTYYGDANLSGKVDSSDYSRIDSGYLTQSTGWYNGDFNYDGVINGSDYTLIDNAFNTQGAALTTEFSSPLATPTAQIGSTSAVPEPATVSVLSLAAIAMLGRKRQR